MCQRTIPVACLMLPSDWSQICFNLFRWVSFGDRNHIGFFQQARIVPCRTEALKIAHTGLGVQKSRRIQFGRPSGPRALYTSIWLSFLSTADSSMTNSLCKTSEVSDVAGSDSGRRSAATCWKTWLMWSASARTSPSWIRWAKPTSQRFCWLLLESSDLLYCAPPVAWIAGT